MGAWGPGLFSDDTTCEVRDDYVANLKRGMSDRAAENQVLDRFSDLFSNHEVKCLVYFGLAATQCRYGRLSPRVKKETLALLEAGGDLAGWEEDSASNVPARRKALMALQKQVAGPQKARMPVKVEAPKEKKKRADLPHGTVFAMPLPDNAWAALMLVRHVDYGNQTLEPSFRLIDWSGSAAPTRQQLQKLSSGFVQIDGIDEIQFMKRSRENPIARLVQTDVVLQPPEDEPGASMSSVYDVLAEEVGKALAAKDR
jgi:hypothetical protein